MQKIILMVLCFMFVLLLVGCGTTNRQIENDPISNNSEEHTVNLPVPDVSENGKKLLKLQFFPIIPEEQLRILGEEQATPTVEAVDIAYSDLMEIDGKPYSDNPELQVFSDYIKETYNIALDKNWKIFVHFYDMDKTVGMVKFQYLIGEEIETNKCIVFNLNQGKADSIFYTCLDGTADEDALLDRVSSFKEKYEQEQYQLKDGEKLEAEITYYFFNYYRGDLSYCYNVLFSYNNGLINNDYGTECFIDKAGNAMPKQITQGMNLFQTSLN